VTDRHDRVLWGIGTSRTMRAHWALQELRLDYRVEPVRTRSPEVRRHDFLALSPNSKIPVLQEHGLVLRESAAIVLHLMATTDRLPHDPASRASLFQWCFFAMMELDAISLYVIRRHGDLSAIYGEAPAAVAAARAYFSDQLHLVEHELRDGRDFIVGDAFTAADILLGSCLFAAQARDLPLTVEVSRYLDALTRRPAFGRARAINYPDT